jgi:hypothetical protein
LTCAATGLGEHDFLCVLPSSKSDVSANTRISEELVEADRSQKVDVVSNDTQILNVEPSKRLKMDELHQDKVTQKNVASW